MKSDNLYIQMFSVHGLLRAENMELGRDPDTGGQIKYVVELAQQVSLLENVKQVDLFTRLIDDKTVSEDYKKPIEIVNDKYRIIRIQCGGRKYIRKELLWPHLAEYIDKTIKFIKQEELIPDIVHGHYADAGYVAKELSLIFGIPFFFTGHSLGIPKKQKLINEGLKEEDIVKKYKIDHRIMVEEEVLKKADLIITSTNQEIEQQYGLYENSHLPKFQVTPPGIDISKFHPYYHDMFEEANKDELAIHAHASVVRELNRFFLKPDKPLILSLCRTDKRKNIPGLIKAYGEDLELQSIANLAIFAGLRKDIADKDDHERDVLIDMLLLLDKYDLYGKMAIPKKTDFEYEVPELYRIAANSKGVFVNAALTEPFGLTLLEAAACGVPIVATNDGGPKDIMKNCLNGILIDPNDSSSISSAIKDILINNDQWEQYSKNGIVNVREHYTWKAHAQKYISGIRQIKSSKSQSRLEQSFTNHIIGKRLAKLKYFLITDIDNTLIDEENEQLDQLMQILHEQKDLIGFGVATGRTVDSVLNTLKEYEVPIPDFIISSVGTEIYLGAQTLYDKGWDAHLSHKWNKNKLINVLHNLDFLELQEEENQRKFKLSYYVEPNKDYFARIHQVLTNHKLKYNLIYSHDQFLDIIPYRASKGKAIRYISYKWEIPLENIMVCGDSGNDVEMLKGDTLALVVGNYSHELNALKGLKRVYFSSYNCASGIIDGLEYYNLIEKAKSDEG